MNPMSTTPPTPGQPAVIDYAAPPQQPRRFLGGGLLGWVLFVGLAIMLFVVVQSRRQPFTEISLSDFRNWLQAGAFAEVVIETDDLHGSFVSPMMIKGVSVVRYRVTLPQGMGANWSFVQWVLDNGGGTTVRADTSQNVVMNLLVPLIPWILIFAFIWFFVFRQLRRSGTTPQAPLPVFVVNTPNPRQPPQ
jgi:ATP-dependent Zn protease